MEHIAGELRSGKDVAFSSEVHRLPGPDPVVQVVHSDQANHEAASQHRKETRMSTHAGESLSVAGMSIEGDWPQPRSIRAIQGSRQGDARRLQPNLAGRSLKVSLLAALGMLGVLTSAYSAPQDSQTASDPAIVLKKAELLIERRESSGSLQEAIALLGAHVSDPGQEVPMLVHLAEAHARLVDTLDLEKADEKPKHKEHREAGRKEARRAVELDPKNGPAHYWYGFILLFCADGEQSYGLLKQALGEMELADRLSPDVDGAGPARMLGRIYQETPGWPFLGSNRKAIEYFERAQKLAPAHLRNHLWLGLAYEYAGKKSAAREQLERVVASSPHPGHEKEEEAMRTEAETHLKALRSR